ncbi:MAG: hypothetical protein E7330_02255 [Clostridiales bacterium]|nr:hypothetical protein [Clostridiales bacterium]
MKRIIPLLIAVLLFSGCKENELPQPVEIAFPSEEPAAPEGTPPVSACPAEGMPAPEEPKMEYCSVVCNDAVNLRESPSAKAALLAEIPAGTRVRVLGFESRYAKVEVPENGNIGYMIAGYLMPENSVYSAAVVQPTALYTYETMMADIAALQVKHANLLLVETLGASAAGQDIPLLVLGDRDTAAHHVFVQASIHGREHMTSLLAMALSEAWLDGGASSEVCFHVVPMVNPDGVSISQGILRDPSLEGIYKADISSGRTERKYEDYLALWKANYNGVDLNRNFDALWENVDTAPHISSEGYRGDFPESEPETQAISAYTKRYPFAATVSYHCTGSLIYWQFGTNSPADDMALALAKLLGSGAGYSIEPDDGISFGGYKDWASSVMGIPSLTVEIGSRSAPLPEIDFYNIWIRNRNAFEIIENWVKNA